MRRNGHAALWRLGNTRTARQLGTRSINATGPRILGAAGRTEVHGMRRLLILVAASLLALGAWPAPAWAQLFVSSSFTDQVLRYDGTTGAFIDIFASGGGLDGPRSLVFGPDGSLYVASFLTNQVLRYDGTTGAFIDAFVTTASGGLSGPHGLVFKPPAAGIPTLSEWGMIGLLLLGGLRALRYHVRPGLPRHPA